MALDKQALQQSFISIFNNPSHDGNVEQIAAELADAIDVYVKSGTVQTTVTGTDSQGGAITGSGIGTIQ